MFNVVMIDVGRTRKVQSYVVERCSAGLCLHPGCTEPQRALGNCRKHAQNVYYRLRGLPKAKRSEARAKLIQEGMILAAGECYELRASGDPVAAAIREVTNA